MNTLMFLCASDTKISDAALYSVIGFVIVLLVLLLLVGIFYLTGFVFKTKFMSKDNLFERKGKNKASDSVESADADDEQEVVAAITAAITAVLSEENESDAVPEFVIRRIKRNK